VVTFYGIERISKWMWGNKRNLKAKSSKESMGSLMKLGIQLKASLSRLIKYVCVVGDWNGY
jgi:hypothetical protein